MFDLVMFDLDGTLIDTAPEITDAVNATLRELALAPVDEAQIRRWIGHGTHMLLLQALASARGVDAQALRAGGELDRVLPAFNAHYIAHCGRRSRPYRAVESTLATLQRLHVRTALVTNKETAFTLAVLDAHRLRGAFDLLVCGDTLAARKPDALPVRHCLESLGVAARRALLVGDSEIDIATARAAGVAVWAVPYGYNGGRPIAEALPDKLIDDVSAVADAVQGSRLRVA